MIMLMCKIRCNGCDTWLETLVEASHPYRIRPDGRDHYYDTIQFDESDVRLRDGWQELGRGEGFLCPICAGTRP